jgi:hypothetical protein
MRSLALYASVLLLVSASLQADTTYVTGEVSGTWTPDGNPYLVTGDLLVPSGSQLVIEPGVKVVFEAYYRFFVNGRLDAQGTDTDSISFAPLHEDSTWGGLRFVDAQDTSVVRYSRFHRGEARTPCPDCYGGGVYCDSSFVFVEHNLFEYCDGSAGGAIFAGYCDPVIRWNEIRYCDSGGGGGICAFFGSPLIEGNILHTDSAWSGGGICLYSSSSIIRHNRITDCWADTKGGGIFCQNSDPLIEGNEILMNVADDAGGGIAVNDSLAPQVRHNNIQGNSNYGLYQGNDAYPVDAAENYWGDVSGPYHPLQNPLGRGDSVSDHVEFIPWATAPLVSEGPSDRVSFSTFDLRVRPNPAASANDVLLSARVRGDRAEEPYTLRLIDATGRILASGMLSPGETIRLSDLCPRIISGVYFLICSRESGAPALTSRVVLLRTGF